MTLRQFIERYDKAGVVVLLEGKRVVPEAHMDKLISLGRLLATQTQWMQFRSGNAEGSDFLFSKGICSVDSERLQVITPYAGHRRDSTQGKTIVSLDEVNLAAEPEIVYHSKLNRKNERIIDQYLQGERNRSSIKAAYIIRDTVKVLGTRFFKPAAFGIFYDDPDNPRSGGTGHTMNVCINNNIPVIDQLTWFGWL